MSTGLRARASAMRRVDDQRHLGVRQPLAHDPGRHALGVGFDGDAGVDPLLVQVVEDVLGRRGQDLEPHARQIFRQIAKQARHEDLRHAGAHAERQRIGRRAAQPPRGVRQAEHVADDALGVVEKGAAALGQLDAARRAAEQRESRSRPPRGCTCSLTADCEMLSRVAARVKLRSLATERRVANFAEFHSMFRGAAPLQRSPTMMENRPRANPPGPAESGIFHLTWTKPPPGKRVIGGCIEWQPATMGMTDGS